MLRPEDIDRAERRDALSVDDARASILDAAPVARSQEIPLAESYGRFATAVVTAPCDLPRFDTAAMDGWAVRGGVAGLYRIVGESRAGEAFHRELGDGEAIRISTGAALPAGADQVVRWEHCTERGAMVELRDQKRARDIRERGSDFRVGDVLLTQGKRVDHLDVARLAAAGVTALAVGQRPKMAILATGDELAAPGAVLEPGQIHDALSLPIAMRAGSSGALVSHVIAAADDLAATIDVIARLEADVIVTIGGASRGSHDHVRAAFSVFGLSMMVPAVLMRPGKPFWFGVLGDGRFVLGLPGNPVAALTCAELFLWPFVERWQGAALNKDDGAVMGPALAPVDDRMDRFQFGMGTVSGAGQMRGRPSGCRDSAALLPLKDANMLFRQPAGRDRPFGRFIGR